VISWNALKMTMSFVKPGIDAHGGLKRGVDGFDQGSVIGGADQVCIAMICALS